jgi:dihydrofolate reductase
MLLADQRLIQVAMIINIVVAASDNNVIGKDNKLLWNLPNDTAFFKNITYGMPVIMGRKTFESLGKSLKGRTNIVITRHPNTYKTAFSELRLVKVASLDEAIRAAEETDAKECYVIGGGEIYRQAISITNRIYITRVHTTVEGDTFFPVIDEKIWKLTHADAFGTDSKHAFPYRFETWERI